MFNIPNEIWKPIERFPWIRVSDMGRVECNGELSRIYQGGKTDVPCIRAYCRDKTSKNTKFIIVWIEVMKLFGTFDGRKIDYVDGDYTNCRFDNLILVNRKNQILAQTEKTYKKETIKNLDMDKELVTILGRNSITILINDFNTLLQFNREVNEKNVQLKKQLEKYVKFYKEVNGLEQN